jgi:hypothetical protein
VNGHDTGRRSIDETGECIGQVLWCNGGRGFRHGNLLGHGANVGRTFPAVYWPDEQVAVFCIVSVLDNRSIDACLETATNQMRW